MLWRYFELVELPRVCWRESQMLHRRSCVHTAPHSGEYLQEAAELDGGKVPEIGLAVCLKAQRGHADQHHIPIHVVFFGGDSELHGPAHSSDESIQSDQLSHSHNARR
jgi:hypothetical protein